MLDAICNDKKHEVAGVSQHSSWAMSDVRVVIGR